MLQVLLSITIFLTGLVVGSFLNCVIYRLALPKGRPQRKAPKQIKLAMGQTSFLRGRSYCPHCKHILHTRDLIPVLSFILLKRKCRYCGKKISLQYPLVEIATGLLFILIFNFEFLISNKILIFNFETIIYFLYLLMISSLLIIVFVFDLKHYIIPDKIIFSAIFIVLLFRILELIQNSNFKIQNLNPAFTGLGAAGFFLFIVLVSRGRWMGFGDVKLAFLIGLFLGFPNILIALFFAFLIGAIIGVGLILAKRKTLKSEVPFGPFLVTGTFIALFWSPVIIDWYLNLFHLNI